MMALVLWFSLQAPLSGPDSWVFDQFLSWRGRHAPPVDPSIVVVALDETILESWPGPRQEYAGLARLLGQLRVQGARVVALDALVSRGEESDFQPLWAEFSTPPGPILGRTFHYVSRHPADKAAPEQGLIYVNADADGRLRSYPLARQNSEGTESLPSLALACYLRQLGQSWNAGIRARPDQIRLGPRRLPNRIWLDTRAPWNKDSPQNFRRVSPAQLDTWERQGVSAQLQGQLVLVGWVAHGTTDLVATVFHRTTPKVAVHALALNALLQDAWYVPLPAWVAGILAVGLAGLASVLASRGGRRGLLVALTGSIGLALLGVALQVGTHFIPWTASWMAVWAGSACLTAWHHDQLRSTRLAAIQILVDGEDPWLLKCLGPYQAVRKLGVGGFASVYQAVPQDTLDPEQSVALKIIHPAHTQNPQIRERFLREVRISSHLQHPNIVQVFAWGEGDTQLYMAMELIQGKPLSHYLEGGRRWSVKEALEVLSLLLKALDYAHQHHVLHRDLKPDNIMIRLDREDQPWSVLGLKVVDFGLAFDDEAGKVTRTGEVLGTLDYLAPERLQGKAEDPRSDLYAVGVIAYEMLSGSSPFPQKATGEAILFRLSQDPPPLAELGLGLPADLSAAVARLMDRHPDQRPANPAEALRALGL